MHHRPEIDGLRAVAVVPVVLFHAGAPGFSGGFIGVDVFFVVSGYLITLIRVSDLSQNRLSLRQFYIRRARRILPALFAMMFVTLPFAWGWMSTGALEEHSADVLSVLTFSTNFLYLIRDNSYFAPDAGLQPFLHTWSLALEEQFYLLYPVALWLFWYAKPRLLLPALALSALVSFVAADWAAANHAAFYLLPARAWELLVGAIIAFMPSPRRNSLLGIAGIAMIVTPVALFDAGTPFPGRYALLPVLGSAFVLRYAVTGTPAARLLSLRPLTFLGLISYSTYLWHQPLLAITRLYNLAEPAPYLRFRRKPKPAAFRHDAPDGSWQRKTDRLAPASRFVAMNLQRSVPPGPGAPCMEQAYRPVVYLAPDKRDTHDPTAAYPFCHGAPTSAPNRRRPSGKHRRNDEKPDRTGPRCLAAVRVDRGRNAGLSTPDRDETFANQHGERPRRGLHDHPRMRRNRLRHTHRRAQGFCGRCGSGTCRTHA
ncbi:hypothetical protein HYN69_18645 (plasmid) [Gemmobacter aquarius]|uniref:Acyltransferase 3 domain-containing protein n=1 Tax=Paragemmobacter aquarius TaxID=2169400 RepID=A0A2S0US33_9RHOB|nr:acyltransferase [Gemmobacter aquarius]AWB50621.1 hypothetical protein HYN69_18645 [Gemmobacter aquarius]